LTEPKKKKDNFNMSDKQNKQKKSTSSSGPSGWTKRLPVETFQRNGILVISKTDHTLSRITSTVKNMSKKEILPKQKAAQPEDASEKYELFELFELSDKAATKHFTRIVSGDFPWSKLNQLATGG
jgi:hypothetical protein